MSKEMGVVLLGVLNIVIATNLLGVPGSWRAVILVISGIGLMVLGFMLRNEKVVRRRGSVHHPFVENDAMHAEPDHVREHHDGLTSLN